MKNTYTLTIKAKCPKHDGRDVYTATVESPTMIEVERIIDCVKDSTRSPAFQEELTAMLAFKLGATVRTVGWHSGVLTECVAP